MVKCVHCGSPKLIEKHTERDQSGKIMRNHRCIDCGKWTVMWIDDQA